MGNRDGQKPISSHIPKEAHHYLKLLAAEQDKTIRAIFAEALDLVFEKYGKPAIAMQSVAKEKERQPAPITTDQRQALQELTDFSQEVDGVQSIAKE